MARAAPASVRAVRIIALLTANPARRFTISALARQLRMNLSSAHTTLAVLCDYGFLVRDPVDLTYALGPALTATGFTAMEQNPAVDSAIEQADILSSELGMEVGLSARAGLDIITLFRCGPEQFFSEFGYVGDRVPLLAPIGAVLMAWAREEDVADWLARGSVTEPRAGHYRNILAEVRARGYSVMPQVPTPGVIDAFTRLRTEPAVDTEAQLVKRLHEIDEVLVAFDRLDDKDEIRVGVIAAPIFDPMGQVLLSLAITGDEEPMPIARIRELGTRLLKSAAIATRRARGRPKSGAASKPG